MVNYSINQLFEYLVSEISPYFKLIIIILISLLVLYYIIFFSKILDKIKNNILIKYEEKNNKNKAN